MLVRPHEYKNALLFISRARIEVFKKVGAKAW